MLEGKNFEVGDVSQFVAGGTVNEGGHSNAMSNVIHLGREPDVAQQLVVINEAQRQIIAKLVSATIAATGKAYDDIAIEVHAKFSIKHLADLPQRYFPEAIAMLESWQSNPPDSFGLGKATPAFHKRIAGPPRRFLRRIVTGSVCTIVLILIVGGTMLSQRIFAFKQCHYDGKVYSTGSVINMQGKKAMCIIDDGIASWH